MTDDTTITTKTNMALAELTEKGADADLLREMIQFVAQRMMEMDTESLCAAAYAERSPDRADSRNGYRERLWETRAGSVDLKIHSQGRLRYRTDPLTLPLVAPATARKGAGTFAELVVLSTLAIAALYIAACAASWALANNGLTPPATTCNVLRTSATGRNGTQPRSCPCSPGSLNAA